MANSIIKTFLCVFIINLGGYVDEIKAQAHDFRSYTVSDGLPDGYISDIHQTKDGFIWIGSSVAGLVRFDGHTYETYGRTEGLKDDTVNMIFEDSREQLWVATYTGGVAVLKGDTLINPIQNPSLDGAYVNEMFEAPDGKIWICTYENGIFIYDGENLDHMSEANGLLDNTVWYLHWDEDGAIWMATHRGLSKYEGNSFQHFNTDDGISGDKVFKIIEHEGSQWIATSRGITIFDGNEFSTITEVNGRQLNYVYDITKASDGRIWIGMENDGIYWYDDGNFTHITRSDGLASNYIFRFFEDMNENMWVATYERGISVYRGQGFRFYNTSHGLQTNEILSLFRDDENTIWIGTENGLESFDGNSFSQYEVPDGNRLNDYIWDIEQLVNGNLLLLLENSKILEFNGVEFIDYSNRDGFGDWFIYDLKIDSEGFLWIGTDEGLKRYGSEGIVSYEIEDGTPGNVIYHIYESKEGDIWIATNSGAARFDGENFLSIRMEDGLGHYNVNYITQDEYGDMWFGTGGGVTHYQPATDNQPASIRNFDRLDGMKLVDTLFLWFDDDGQLWQGTNGGIHYLDIAGYRETGDMKIEHYPLSKHGIGVEMMHKANITDQFGRAWFGSINGIIVLDPDQLEKKDTPPATYINNIQMNGLDVNWSDLADSIQVVNGRSILPSVEFPYGNHSFSFSYTGLEYLYPENVQYRYKLDGFEEDWNPVTELKSATYTNLDSGNYRFLVEARVGSGPWSAEAASYSFSVNSPFWQATWFWALAIIGAAFLIAGFIRLRLNRLERVKLNRMVDEQTHHLQSALEEKEVLLKEVHHRVKNNLAVICGLLELQSSYIDDERSHSIFKESQLRIRSIAMVHEKLYQNENISRIETQKYIPELTDVIIQSLSTQDKNINLELDIDDISLTIDQGVPCGLILNELISNVYKHAFNGREKGNAKVLFKKNNGSILLRVEDDGNGLPEGYEIGDSNSLGLVLVKTLTTQINADLSIESNGNGTSFELVFEKDEF